MEQYQIVCSTQDALRDCLIFVSQIPFAPRSKNKTLIFMILGWRKSQTLFHAPKTLRLGSFYAIVDPDGSQTTLSRALLGADFGPVGRNQHPARLRERT